MSDGSRFSVPVARITDTFRCFIRAPVDSMVGLARHCTRSGGPPARSMARRMTSAVSRMQRRERGWGLITMALRPLTAMIDLNRAVEVGLVVGMIPATTPTGVATSCRPVASSREMKPTVRSPATDSQVPSLPKRFFSTL